MQQSYYHSILRVAALTVALVLLFDSGLISQSTKELSDNAQNYLASAIGIQASVFPSDINQLTADLTAQKRQLDEREAALSEREISVGLSTKSGEPSDTSTYILSTILFILLVLILLNYVLDYMRQSRVKLQQKAT